MKTLLLLLLLTSQIYAYGPVKPDAAKKAAYQAAKLQKREVYLKKVGRFVHTTIVVPSVDPFYNPRCHKQHDYSVLNRARAVAREAEIKEFGHVRTPQELGFEP